MTRFYIPIFLSLILILGFSGCDSSDGGPLFTVKTVNLSGLQNEDVYFIFTNPSPVDDAPVAPLVSYSEMTGIEDESRVQQSSQLYKTAVLPSSGGVIDAQLWKGPDGLSPETGSSFRGSGVSYSYIPPVEVVGTTKVTFRGASSIDPAESMNIPATCRGKVDSVDGRTLVIFVADDCWFDSDVKENRVDQEMVDALIDEFLNADTGNGIWVWMRDIFGEPWGVPFFSNLIESGAEDYITILLYDIAVDGNKDDYNSGGIVGYFSSGNNYLESYYQDSNERLMFAMDAVRYADKDGALWDKTDFWPQSVFSTLAHEFQHMIHYYQKQIVFDVSSSDTWLNEMCSMVAEDLLADKIGVAGPRGVDPPTEGSASVPDNCSSSRISTYNYWNNDSLTIWGGGGDDILRSYASTYAFGAYIARNYGGAALFRDIVQNGWTDELAVTEAIAEQGYGIITFKDLLIEWAEASIISGSIGSVKAYNRGVFVQSSPTDPDGSGYNLGSINLYNYDADDGVNNPAGSGPVLYGNESGTFNPASLEATPPASNVIFLAGSNLSGDYTWNVEIPTGMVLTVFKK